MKKFGYLLLLFAGYLCTRRILLNWNTREVKTDENEIQIRAEQIRYEQKQKAGDQAEKQEKSTESETAASSAASQSIRVLITDSDQDSYYHDKVILKSSGTLCVEGSDDKYSPGTEISIGADSELLKSGSCHIYPENPGDKIAVSTLKRAYGIPEYEGSFYIQKHEKGLCLINELDVEAYLKYVVPSEMPSSYETEALKAQAVCARTYAFRQMQEQRLKDYDANVDDTVSFQVYNNQKSTEATDSAVKETAGQIMTVDGKPIEAYFFSTSCGHTSTDAVWNGKSSQSYLQGIYLGDDINKSLDAEPVFSAFIQNPNVESYDSGETWYRWRVELPWDYLNERIKSLKIGGLSEISVAARSESGIVSKLVIKGTEGEKVLENEYKIRELLKVKGYEVVRNDGSVTKNMTLMPSAYFVCKEVKDESGNKKAYQFIGGGYGHGVGLSQNGANHMAENGKNWKEILCFFYNGIEIETYV